MKLTLSTENGLSFIAIMNCFYNLFIFFTELLQQAIHQKSTPEEDQISDETRTQ